ncbi:MAG: hypothetical protein AABX39_06270 [Nanoarchaeota archaeon]
MVKISSKEKFEKLSNEIAAQFKRQKIKQKDVYDSIEWARINE